jgi:hypothetical protein
MTSDPGKDRTPAGQPGGQGAGPDPGQPNSGGPQNPGGPAAASPDPGPDPAPKAPGRRANSDPGYADAASQVGGGQLFEQNRERNRALIDFLGNQVDGDVLFGDKFELSFGQGGSRMRVRRITPEELTGPFVWTPVLERLATQVSDQPVVVLHGPSGYGKGAALVRALRRDHRGAATMFFVAPTTDLATFSCADVPQDSVLILQDFPDGAADRLGAYTVGKILSELRGRGCRLGITTGKAANFTTLSADLLVIEHDARPSPQEVYRRHLSELLIGTGVTPDDVLAWPDVGPLLDAHLGPDCSLADAARMAMLLSRARDEPETAAQRVRTQMTEYSDEKVAQWFRNLDSLKAQCMAISLAVLNGLSRETIAQEARWLEERILPPPDAANAPAMVNPFGPDAAVSPSLLQARVVAETRMTGHGPIIIRTMSYQETGYPGQVLRYVWRERDDGRAPLVDWLRHLGRSPDLAVQVRGATAVGVLACEALDYLHHQIILGWAHDDDGAVRNSAAIALAPPAGHPLVRDTVRSLVADWAREGSARMLRMTAARTYGRSIGLHSPSLALRQLSRLAEADDLPLKIAASNSYCELVLDGTPPLSMRVLGEVEKLAADRSRAQQVVGRLCLLGLSYLRGAPPALSDQETRLRPWPTLLVLSQANPRFGMAAGGLWRLSLNDTDIGSLVTASLDDWALAAEDLGEMRPAFAALMRMTATDERGRQAVLRRAQLWSGRNGKAPKTGQLLIEDLG